MRILHTSDWHLGRQFHGHSLDDDHANVLDQVHQALLAHQPDVLVIAGDIYDRASPPTNAIRQFNIFIERLAQETTAAVVLIAGNHDSGDRIGAMGALTDRKRALIRGPLSKNEIPLVLEDAHGQVAFSALPFGWEFAARECFARNDINCPQDVIRAQIDDARARVPKDARWVVAAHGFVTGANLSGSERPLSRVGGIETISLDVFAGAHYVALGHLHRAQSAGADHIRYSGSPLAFGFDESVETKSMTLVDLSGDGSIKTQCLPFTPLRAVRTIRGQFADVLAGAVQSNDFVKVVLTDKSTLIDPMKQIRVKYPNAGPLLYERDETPFVGTSQNARMALNNPSHVIEEFIKHVRGEPQTDVESSFIKDALSNLSAEESLK